jgi:5'-nucleotidase
MPIDPSDYFVVGISSRALFDLAHEDSIFHSQGEKKYSEYQIERENLVLSPGTGFPLVKAILKLNGRDPKKKRVMVFVMSRNNADTSLRVMNSIRHYGLEVERGAFTSGAPLAPYLKALSIDLFLSASLEDVQDASNAGLAAGLIYPFTKQAEDADGLRIAFDGDAVLFSDDSEKRFKEEGLDAFLRYEREHADQPLEDGPFAKLFRALAALQQEGDAEGRKLIRTALVTARNSPADERVIKTLRAWKVRVDEAFFLGGVNKAPVLEAFRPHIFFDDQDVHCKPASEMVPTARVLVRKDAPAQPTLFPNVATAPVAAEFPNSEKKPSDSIPAVIIAMPNHQRAVS